MSGELEAAAADSLGHLVSGRGKHSPPIGTPCANCDAPLQGHFCHNCGQNADPRHRSVWRLVYEAAEALFELDGRLWRTLPALFLRPGKLARDYMDGRIARHVPPFRTFLVALLLFVFAAEHTTHEMTLANNRQKLAEAAKLATPQGRAEVAAKRRSEAQQSLNENIAEAARDRAEALKDKTEKPGRPQETYDREVGRAQARYGRALARADRIAQGLPAQDVSLEITTGSKGKDAWWKTGIKKATDNPDYYWTVVFTWGHRVAIVLLPVVGLSLALVYRKRREIYIYDHLLVAMNVLSFSFLVNALGLVLPFSLMGWWFALVGIWTPINLFQTLRGGYGSTILGAALKTLVVWSIAIFASTTLLTGLLVLAIAEL